MALQTRRSQAQRISLMGRERSGLDTANFDEQFQGSTINPSQWSQSTSGMTIAQNNGVTLNNGGSTTSGNYAILTSYVGTGLSGAVPLYLHFLFSLNQAPVANQVTELGAGFVATNAAPTDGVFLRLNGTQVQCVVNANGTEQVFTVDTTSGAGLDAAIGGFKANVRYRLEIEAYDDFVAFYINSLLIGTVDTGLSGCTNSNSWPFQARTYNSGVPSAAQKVTVYRTTSMFGDAEDGKPWPHVAACAGWGAYQGRTGSGVAQTANWSNSAAFVDATLSNTAAGYTTLGGYFSFAAVAGANTDYALFAFQNPAGTATAPGAQLHITGYRIDTANAGAAVATTATQMLWGLAVGATAVSLATADAAAAKAPRRVALGTQNFQVAAAIGAQATPIGQPFVTPMVANPGEFVHVILRMPVATATASEKFQGTVLLEGYFD